jgi:hypothetical protein
MSKQAVTTAGDSQRGKRPEKPANLDRQYGTIGISAVAAALPYCGNAKNPANARTGAQDDERSEFDTRSVLAV